MTPAAPRETCALAVLFGWAWGLTDWRLARALGLPEAAVRRMRQRLGLVKGSGGVRCRSQGRTP